MHGQEELTGCYLVRGEATALVETGPKSTVQQVLAGLAAAGVERLDWIVVTHVHLDHAGAAGTLAARFPEARVAVHPVGAPHLVDPSRLWDSASRIYGDAMEQLWGGVDPIPEDRIQTLDDGDKIDLGGRSLQAIETPGHAYHHHVFLDDTSGWAFTGDALGLNLPGVDVIRPTTPPPEFHLEKAITSIQRLKTIGADLLCPTHFGPADGAINDLCDAAVAAMNDWAEWVREGRESSRDLDEVTAHVQERARSSVEGSIGADVAARLEQASSARMNTWGYMRYLDKIEER